MHQHERRLAVVAVVAQLQRVYVVVLVTAHGDWDVEQVVARPQARKHSRFGVRQVGP